MITIFGAGGLSDADVARLRRVESKLDLILQNLGIPWQEPDPAAGLSAEVRTLVEQGRKIEAIKVHRELTGLGLRDAKLAVDQYQPDLRR